MKLSNELIEKKRLLTALMVRRKIRTEKARRRTLPFIDYTNQNYQAAQHHILMCELADKLIHLKNQRILVSLPPRHGKSEIFSVRLPALYLGVHPEKQIIHASYAANLSNEFSRQVRGIVRDDLNYQRLFPRTSLDPDRQRIDDWKTTLGGGFISRGVGGGISGHGADLAIVDDPHKEGDENSPEALKTVKEWYNAALRTRMMPGGNIVIVHTRWHTRDLIGSLLAMQFVEGADQWEVITLPALAGEGDILGREVGQALWPERYDLSALKAIEVMSQYYWLALYQQQPLDEVGARFKAEDFERYEPNNQNYGRSAWAIDLALSEKDAADFSYFGRFQYEKETGALFVSGLERLHDAWPVVKARIKVLVAQFPEDVFVFPKHMFELMAVQELKAELPDEAYRFLFVEMNGDKLERAAAFAGRVASGRVWIEQGVAGDQFIREHAEFPSDYDDAVDCSSVAAHHFGLHVEFKALVGYTEDEIERRALLKRERLWQQRQQEMRRFGG